MFANLPLASVLALVCALLLALYLAPVLIRTAHRYGIVDRPQGELKTHTEATPYLGGLVVFLALLLSVAVSVSHFTPQISAVLLGCSLIVAVGLIDDLGTLTPRDKFIGQLIAAAILVKAGVQIEVLQWAFPLEELLTVLFLVTCMNAFNILDVSDGLSSTAAVVGAAGISVASVLMNQQDILQLSLPFLGACLGFLYFNKQPARMYLGDTGSMLLGTLLGALAIMGRYSEANILAPLITPLCFLVVPFFDLLLVILARLWAKKPIYHGSPDHFAVRLRDHGYSAKSVARLAALFGSAVAAAGLFAAHTPDPALLLAAVGVIAALILTPLVVIFVRFPARTSPRFAAKRAPTKTLDSPQPS